MTIQEFMDVLTTCAGMASVKPSGAIRIYMQVNNTTCEFCPITAVLYQLQGDPISLSRFLNAGSRLGLTTTDVFTLVTAADSDAGDIAELLVRERLLEALLPPK